MVIRNAFEAQHLNACLRQQKTGMLPDGWGEVSEWPADRITNGDWSAGVFRSPELANACYELRDHPALIVPPSPPSAVLSGGGQMTQYKRNVDSNEIGAFPVFYSKSAEAQQYIEGRADQYWAPGNSVPAEQWVAVPEFTQKQHPVTARIFTEHAGHLLVTAGQSTDTARLTAVVSSKIAVGVGFLPIPGLTIEQAQALAIFFNSTAGRIQLLRNPGKKLSFPKYNPAAWQTVRIPSITDTSIVDTLKECFAKTSAMKVPQYRDGECEVRHLWDEAVARALDIDIDCLTDLRRILHKEPVVRGVGYNQFR